MPLLGRLPLHPEIEDPLKVCEGSVGNTKHGLVYMTLPHDSISKISEKCNIEKHEVRVCTGVARARM